MFHLNRVPLVMRKHMPQVQQRYIHLVLSYNSILQWRKPIFSFVRIAVADCEGNDWASWEKSVDFLHIQILRSEILEHLDYNMPIKHTWMNSTPVQDVLHQLQLTQFFSL